MTKLAQLIAELCPEGVEFKFIKDIATVSIGEFVHKNLQNSDSPYPVYNGGISNTGFYKDFNRTANKIIVSARGANAGFVNRIFTNFWSGNSCYTIDITEQGLDWTFAYYWLKSKEIKLLEDQQKGGIPAVSKKQIESFLIPVPPLLVQEEIVRILDNFTELIAELKAELTARKKQYEFCRDWLLSLTDVPLIKLGDIATDMYRGSGIKRDQVTVAGIPCVRYGEIYTTYNIYFDSCVSHTNELNISNRKYFEHGDILFAITGESVEDIAKSCAYVGHDKCLAGGDIVVMKHKQNPKYLSYALSTTDAKKQKAKGRVKSKVVHSNVPSISEILIPLPAMEVQNRIIEILDHFDSLCNDLTSGLPAEIAARQKQYEYYRDKLLTFEKLVNNSPM